MLKKLLILLFCARGRRYGRGPVSDACARRLHPEGFQIQLRRDAARASDPLQDTWKSRTRRTGRGSQRRAHPAWHRRERRTVHPSRVRGRPVCSRRPARCNALVHHPTGRDRARSIRQAERRPATRFPRYGYLDMVEAQYRLLTEGLGVHHLRLVMGTSMGGMHTWLWGERHPDFMDALMPLASLPTQISGRNRVWRRIVIDAIRNDPQWRSGNYSAQPPNLRIAEEMLFFMGAIRIASAADADLRGQRCRARRGDRRRAESGGCERSVVPGRGLARLRSGPGP